MISESSTRTPHKNQGVQPVLHWLRTHHVWWIYLIIVALLECVVFNWGFWGTLHDRYMHPTSLTSHVTFSTGPNLVSTGIKNVYLVNGTESYVEATNINAPVYCVHIHSVDTPDWTKINNLSYEWWDEVRVEVKLASTTSASTAASALSDTGSGWIVGPIQKYSPFAPASLYLTVPHAGQKIAALRLQFEQPLHSTLGFAGATLNKYPPFKLNPARLFLMAIAVVFLLALAPQSQLWRMQLETHPWGKQIITFLLALPTLILLGVFIWQNQYINLHALPQGEAGNYVYDFNQYDWIADAILHHHTWVNLPVNHMLASAQNPYSMQTRAHLLNTGVMPIFWDHAFWHGHWYCYFGVLPALVLFIPFQLVTALWVHGGLGLATCVACMFCEVLFAIGSTMLVIRLLQRYFPGSSLAMAYLCALGFQSGAQFLTLLFRQSFYELPYDSALVCVAFGFWFWFGARRVTSTQVKRKKRRNHTVYITRLWTVHDDEQQMHLSKLRLIAGTVCIAATVGCRPPFAIGILLAFPLFWPEIKQMHFFSYLRPSAWKEKQQWRSLPNDLSVLVSGCVTVLPFVLYNYVRFHKITDFGNKYQLTVNDMMTWKPQKSVIWPLVYYYLFQPLHMEASFPLIHVNMTPLPTWQFREPWFAGIIFTVPFLLFSVAAWVRLKELCHRHLLGFVAVATICGLLICVIDAYLGGLSMRYTADFGWLLSFTPVFGAALLLEEAQQHTRELQMTMHIAQEQIGRMEWWVRLVLMLLVGLGVLITALMYFAPNRLSDLVQANPQFYYQVRAIFSNWAQW